MSRIIASLGTQSLALGLTIPQSFFAEMLGFEIPLTLPAHADGVIELAAPIFEIGQKQE